MSLMPGLLAALNDTSFAIEVDWSSGHALPTLNFSIMRLSAIMWPGDGRTYAYSDVVPFSDPYYPASYSSAIGAFSSADGHTDWTYHGIVLRAAKGWSAGGVATPGAAVVQRNGAAAVLVSYTAESQDGGKGTRGIGLLNSTHPLGPFDEMPAPALGLYGDCHSDDSQLLASADGVDLFHRLRRNGANGSASCGLEALNCSAGDCIYHRRSQDGGETWEDGHTARHAAPAGWVSGVWPLQELWDVKRAADGRLVRVNDNWSSGPTPCAGKCLLVYLSNASSGFNEWLPAAPPTLQGSLLAPGSGAPSDLAPDAMTPQVAFLPDASGAITHASVARFTASSSPGGGCPPTGRPFTHFVYRVTRFG